MQGGGVSLHGNQKQTTMQEFKIGDEVVNKNSGYTAGRIGTIVDLDADKQRAKVEWAGSAPTNWVSFKSLHLTSIPYTVLPPEKIYKNGVMVKFTPAKFIVI